MYLHLERYERPDTVEACLDLLAGGGAALLGGGTWLNVACPDAVQTVVDLQALDLDELGDIGGGVHLGASVTLAELLDAEDVPAALAEAARAERNLPLRNRSTVGGRVARPRSDARVATALVALDATVLIERAEGTEAVAAADYLRLPAALRASGLITGVGLARGVAWSGYLEQSLTGVDSPYTDVALAVTADGPRLASGCHAAGPEGTVALPATSAAVAAAGDGWREALATAARDELPAYTDMRASGEYRRELAIVLATRLVAAWREEAG
jgi:xanthine dehydrogenase small subunit